MPEAVQSTTAASSWDFFTGRGPGATRADRAHVERQCAAWALAGTLARGDEFWGYAETIATSKGDDAARETQRIAALYVPRRSSHRAAITRLLFIAARHLADGRPFATYRMLNAGLSFYWVDGHPDQPGARGNALRPDAEVTISLGAELVRRRGARRCLFVDVEPKTGRTLQDCGEELEGLRRPSFGGSDRRGTSRRDYCDRCLVEAENQLLVVRHREAIRTVLSRATPAILSGPTPWVAT